MKRVFVALLIASASSVACKDEAPSSPTGTKPSSEAKPAAKPSTTAKPSDFAAPPASSSAPAAAPSASTSASTAAAPLPPPGCVEPKSLKSHPTSEIAAIIAADPIDPDVDWATPDDKTGTMSANGITYEVSDKTTPTGTELSAVDAKKGGASLFHLPGMQVAGGAVDVSLSPKGTVLASAYSRGGVAFYDAATGKKIADGGLIGYALAPDESYLLLAPVEGAFSMSFDTTDLTVVRLGATPTKKVVASMKSVVKDGDPPYNFGVAICPTGAVFASSHPNGELAIYRASDLTKLASTAKPPNGQPSFTRSGKWVVLGATDGPTGLFELVP